jgi:hypothetical protein
MVCLVAGLVLASAGAARAQVTASEEERLQILTDPDAIKKKLEKDRNPHPFDFFKSKVAPFDVLPYVKPNHWATLTLEMRANDEDYEGFLQTDAVMLPGMPLQVVYRRDAHLLKEQRRGLPQQVLLTRIPKEWTLEIVRPGALRPDASWPASLSRLEPHQMLVLILSKDSTNQFANWSRMSAMIPMGAERDSARDLDRQRYYRLVLPMEPDKPPLSSHPLAWTTISHVIWDGLPPDVLSVSQQQALLDWLHWGGQLIFTGGAGQAYALYHDSFLGPYLPAESTGQTVGLSQEDLRPLSQSYPPPTFQAVVSPDSPEQAPQVGPGFGRVYQAPAPIIPPRDKPLYISMLRPGPGSSTIPMGEASTHLLAVERRVGRGRITMLTLNPIEPVMMAWPGLDTLVRRVILRRPEEAVIGSAGFDGNVYQGPVRGRLGGAELTWYRITSRDARPHEDAAGRMPKPPQVRELPKRSGPEPLPGTEEDTTLDTQVSAVGVADWNDLTRFPTLSRDLLEEASGISIPSSDFVLKVILAYLITVVPVNWLICRFVLNRREWAWVVVPLVALGFAIAVQRVAAYDVGFDSASDEIDLLEVQAEYPRAHLSRFASLYTTGRGNYTISYPNNNTALALPLDNGRSIRGEDVTTSIWQSAPVPELIGLAVQPRSMSLFRAEEMAALAGAIRIEVDGESRRIVNESELELHDATLIDFAGDGQRKEDYLGTIAAGASREVVATAAKPPPQRVEFGSGPDPNSILQALRTTFERRDENAGEIRLVAWVPRAMGGQVIDPPVDRQRGFTAVLVHLRCGPPPNPDGKNYNILAMGPEKGPAADQRPNVELGTPTQFSRRPGRRPALKTRAGPQPPTDPSGPGSPP